MEQINNTITSLEQLQSKSNLEHIIEEYQKMYEQLENERNGRITLIEELKSKLLAIRKHNFEIGQTEEYRALKEKYIEELKKTRDVALYYIALCNYSQEEAHKKQDEKRNRINNKFVEDLDKLGYINEEIVCGYEYEIDEYIKSLYRKYVCKEYGHEYSRNKNGDVEVVMEGFIAPTYEVDAFERYTGRILSTGNSGTPTRQCKFCGEKIYGDEFEPDFIDKKKILTMKREK